MPAIAPNAEVNEQVDSLNPDIPNRLSDRLILDRLIHQFERHPPLQPAGLKILELTSDPDVEFDEIEEVLRTDPVLVTKVFKLANSSFYTNKSTSSLSDACLKLGLKTLRNIAVASSLNPSLSKPLIHYTVADGQAHKHALAVAFYGQLLAQKLKMPRSFQADVFLAGLMHDIGKHLLDQILIESIDDFGSRGVAQELDITQFSHAELGAEFASYWRLPEYICQSAKFHHDPLADNEYGDFSAIVHLSDLALHNYSEGDMEIGNHFVDTESAENLLELLDTTVDAYSAVSLELAKAMDRIDGSVYALLG